MADGYHKVKNSFLNMEVFILKISDLRLFSAHAEKSARMPAFGLTESDGYRM